VTRWGSHAASGVALAAASIAALAGCARDPLGTVPFATSLVTPAGGGIVALPDGRARLDVPPGAVTSAVSITIIETARAAPPGYAARSPVFDLEPAGLVFATPAHVTFAFERATRPGVFWSNTAGGYDAIGGRVSASTITADVTHFSSGFVAELVNGPPPESEDGGAGATDATVAPSIDAGPPPMDAPASAGDAPVDGPVDVGSSSTCQAGLSCAAGFGCAENGPGACAWCACAADGRLACASCDQPWLGSGPQPPTSCGSGPTCTPSPSPGEGCVGSAGSGCLSGCTCSPSGYFTCTVNCPGSDAGTPPLPSCGNSGKWVNRAMAGQPPPWPITRMNPALVFDVPTSRTVMYGGYGGPGAQFLQDTWEWDGAAGLWTPRQGSVPADFDGASVTYDVTRNRLVMYATLSAQLWEWNGLGATWAQRTPVTASAAWPPTAFEFAASAAYDPDRQRVVVFQADANVPPATWEWNPADGTWSNRTTSPAPSTLQWLLWDPARKRSMGFGGQASNEVWEWDGQAGTWTQRPKTGTWPDPRSGAAMVLDAGAGRPLLFGGQAAGGALNPVLGPPPPTYDTKLWEWDGEIGQWRVVDDGTAPSTPAGRTNHSLAYDSARSCVIMFGGGGPSMPYVGTTSELWEWTRNAPADAGCDGGP
jgi:hypothetical protein